MRAEERQVLRGIRAGVHDDPVRGAAEISADLLGRPLDFDFGALARGVCEGGRLPPQRGHDQGFGQPAITLYSGERFLIEALCWHTGTPAIHHHAFSGAFRVMTGRSVHSRYSYSE